MPYARNPVDGTGVYYEDDGGAGAPVVMYGGILDTVESVRQSELAVALREHEGEFRFVYADHRGLGRSDKPHAVEAYAMPLQVVDAVAVLASTEVEKAHFVGRSYGARLAFGIGEHAPDRVLSLVAGGQQPYALNADGPLIGALGSVVDATRRDGAVRFVEALEQHWGARIPESMREIYVAQDGAAVADMFEAMVSSGDLSTSLGEWRVPCLVYLGTGDDDFYEQASRAASEIPGAEFLALDQLDHLSAHFTADAVASAVVRTLRANS